MSNAHAWRHGHIENCEMCKRRVKPYPTGHHSPKRAVKKGSQTKLVVVKREYGDK